MKECDRYRMTLKDLCDFLQLQGPLRNQILGAVFGEDAYIGPYSMIEADNVLLIAFLRNAHAIAFFEGDKAWKSFVEIVSQEAAPSVSHSGGLWLVPPEENVANLMLIIAEGRYLGLIRVPTHDTLASEKLTETYDLLDVYNCQEASEKMMRPRWSTMLSLVDVHRMTLGQIDVYRKKRTENADHPERRAGGGPFAAGPEVAEPVRDDAHGGGDRPPGNGGPPGQD